MRYVVFFCCLVFASAAAAHRKTDVITMYNGDRITGEIKLLSGGLLSLSTDYARTLSIEWQNVARVDSRYNFEVQLASSEQLFGNISNSGKNGELAFTSIDTVKTLDLLSITEMRPIEDTFVDRLNYSIGANFQIEPQLRTNRIQGSVSYEDKGSRTQGDFSLQETVTRTVDVAAESTATDYVGSGNLKVEHQRWVNRGQRYRTFTGNYEFNEALGNDGRLSGGAGLGRYFIDRPGMRLNASAGIQAVIERASLQDAEGELSLMDSEDPSLEDGTNEALEAFISSTWTTYHYGDNDMEVVVSGNLFPSLTESGRVRATANAQVNWEIYDNLYWNLTAAAEFDSDSDATIEDGIGTAETPVDKLDYTITMGIRWSP